MALRETQSAYARRYRFPCRAGAPAGACFGLVPITGPSVLGPAFSLTVNYAFPIALTYVSFDASLPEAEVVESGAAREVRVGCTCRLHSKSLGVEVHRVPNLEDPV